MSDQHAPARAVARAWGIASGYEAIGGAWVPTQPATEQAILRVLGARTAAPPRAPVAVVAAGRTPRLEAGRHEIELEGGGRVEAEGRLPADLPLGYHTLRHATRGRARRLIVTPPTCHLPTGLRGWALAVQLYALRSSRSWGIGDLGDLRSLARWSRERGATSLLLSPLHAPGPGLPQQASPYYPSSRVFRNPLYLAVERAPGAARLGPELERAAVAGRALERRPLIDHDGVLKVKTEALRALFRLTGRDPGFRRWRTAQGPLLEHFATFCALAREHGPAWRGWPEPLRHPESETVRAHAAARADEVSFHAWTQWLLDRQLQEVAAELRPIVDLAVGADPEGADAWAWQEVLAAGTSVGAPPDPFAAGGQSWAVPPFDPWRLRAAGYEPFVQLVRAAFRHAFGLRLDHVMGLFRLYWIPPGADGTAGAYVRYPARDLLGILALESHRARSIVVGEDLGTVEPGVRSTLRRRGVLSYRLLLFEDEPPAAYPEQAFCAATTHDLPTLTGLWQRPELVPGAQARIERATGLDADAPPAEVVVGAAQALASSPCRLASATLEDLTLDPEQPNHPGTVAPENWSRRLPESLEDLETDPFAARVVDALRRPPRRPRNAPR